MAKKRKRSKKRESSTGITIPAGITRPVSARDLSESTGLSVEKCQQSLDELVEAGILEKLEQEPMSGKFCYQIVGYQTQYLQRLRRMGVIR